MLVSSLLSFVERGYEGIMHMQKIASILLVQGLMVTGLHAETVLSRVCSPYDTIQSLSCEIRRDMPMTGAGAGRMLSRVYFQRGDRMHVETVSPLPRRIVCDGTNFWSHIEGMPKGFGVPVSKLNDEMSANLRSVPGSPEMALAPLVDATETPLEATAEYPVRAGYDNGKTFTVLSLDAQGRLARLEVFDSLTQKNLVVSTDYSAYREVLPGVWIATIQKTQATLRGKVRTETLRVGNLEVNGVLPVSLFNSEAYFKGIEFVDSFDKLGPPSAK